jgi:hypothetical protein
VQILSPPFLSFRQPEKILQLRYLVMILADLPPKHLNFPLALRPDP